MDSRGGRHGSLDAKRGKTNGSADRRMVFQGARERQASRETNCLRIGDQALKERKKKKEKEKKR